MPICHPARFALLPLTLALASSLCAQTIADENMVYTQGALSPLLTEAAIVDASLQVGGPLSANHAVKYWWFYRVHGDPREYPLHEDGSNYQVFLSPSAQNTYWPNVDGRNFWMALRSEIYSTGPANGYVVNRMTLWNRTNAPMTADVFLFVDLDVCGATSTNIANITRDVHTVTDGCGRTFQVHAQHADHSEAGDPALLRASLCDGGVTTLADNFGALPAGDYAGAFSWTWTLQPGQAALNVSFVTCDVEMTDLPLHATFGIQEPGAGFVPPILRTRGAPIQNSANANTFFLELSQAPANTAALYLLALGRGNTTIGGISVFTDLATTMPTFWVTDANGIGSLPVTVPAGSNLLGLPLAMQCIVADSGAWNGFCSWTYGHEVTLGHQ